MKSLYKYMDQKGIDYRVEYFGGSYFYDNTLNVNAAGVPDIEINETCKKIMAAYERDYRDFIKNARKAGA